MDTNFYNNFTIMLRFQVMNWGKTQVQFLQLSTLDSPIEFKYMVALTNETQTMLSFPRIFKFNIFEFNQEPNVLDLRNCI